MRAIKFYIAYGANLDHKVELVDMHPDGDGTERTWAIKQGGCCLTKYLDFEYEPSASSRTNEFLDRCRFTFDDALVLIEKLKDIKTSR